MTEDAKKTDYSFSINNNPQKWFFEPVHHRHGVLRTSFGPWFVGEFDEDLVGDLDVLEVMEQVFVSAFNRPAMTTKQRQILEGAGSPYAEMIKDKCISFFDARNAITEAGLSPPAQCELPLEQNAKPKQEALPSELQELLPKLNLVCQKVLGDDQKSEPANNEVKDEIEFDPARHMKTPRVAAIFDVCDQTACRMASSGEIPAVKSYSRKAKGEWLFDKKAVMEMLQEQENGAAL